MSQSKDSFLALRFDDRPLRNLTRGGGKLGDEVILGFGNEAVNVLILLLVTEFRRTV